MSEIAAVLLPAGIAFAVTALLGFIMIPWLRKLHFGQTILDIGPRWHKSKQGTPTMGGLLFIIGTVAAVVVTYMTDRLTGGQIMANGSLTSGQENVKLFAGLCLALCFAGVGFLDDYIKVVKKRNLGLTVRQKTVIQLFIIIAYLGTLYMSGASYLFLPFIGNVELGLWMFPLGIVVIYAAINAVNFTDGIDGLCSSVTLTAGVAFAVMAAVQKVFGMGILAGALIGACAGFLVWNFNPAKVFMGDTGSLFLGGMVVALAYGLDCPIILVLVGIVYVLEGLSDVLQIGYFKLTHGKRIFKMAPIHHHFEMCGWSEKKIVGVFSLVNAVGCAAGIALMYYGRV